MECEQHKSHETKIYHNDVYVGIGRNHVVPL